jgi:hypothetical protein
MSLSITQLNASVAVTQSHAASPLTVAVPGSIAGPQGPAGSRSGQEVTWCFAFPASADVVADLYTIQLKAPYAATLQGVDFTAPSGSFVAAVLLDAVPVTFAGSLSSFTAAAPTVGSLDATANAAVALGALVALQILSAAGGAKGGVVNLRLLVA